MSSKLIAISDIHGMYDKFISLLKNLEKENINFREDTIIQLGDCIDGGPDSCKVISKCIELKKNYPHWQFLRGNHCQMLLDALVNYPDDPQYFAHWYYQGGKETVESYKRNSNLSQYDRALANPRDVIFQTHIDWMNNLDYYVNTDKFFFVHAGVEPGRAPEFASNEAMLWIRGQFINSTYQWGKRIIAGHTYHKEPVVMKNKIILDTMMHGHGEITAVILDDENPEWYKFVHSNGEIKHD